MWDKIDFAKVPIIGIGLIAGIVSSMFGVGGGIILVPMFIFLLNFDIHEAVGTSLVIIIPTVLVGAYAHYRLGNVNLMIALIVIVGAVIGAWIGAHIAEQMQSVYLEKAFGVLLLVISLKMILGK
ncbi:MAG: sulfite exporter TauE/SafE family protein [Halobacteriota archaeon]